jgi:hypothetical protein
MAQHRWVCPSCQGVKLGSSRPRPKATSRFCLPCSEKSGELVERTCPVLDKQREAKAEQAKARRAKATEAKARRRERLKAEASRISEAMWHYGDYDLRVETGRILDIAAGEGYKAKRPRLSVRWRHGGDYCTGRSWGGRVHLTIPEGSLAAPALVVLAHELAHEICVAGTGHGAEWRFAFRLLVRAGYGAEVPIMPGGSSHDLHKALVQAVAGKLGETITGAQLENESDEAEINGKAVALLNHRNQEGS